ncbi:hypothetical protein PPERSA_10614 [Pseudocohnilembus persalinus]|uniref:Penicillin acylase family protein n=1 Tax=Pseudocohnilembus persalinus TaxID=266149 RepID=A0A0V0R0N1_PSEPJ|nr:hypothetical protein PPERSA_10614 [Pseudocohnilembus persalinus]|eukprot:KRX07979.1 hypothetical protein PPERSA_10614 [Pseudocohnilembus persalinus]
MGFLRKTAILFVILVVVLYYGQKSKYQGVVFHNQEKYGDIKIYREKEHGIPHILAEDLTGACYGQGYVHAQDRLFQMHMKRLFGTGRLSEFLGPMLIQVDEMMREIGLFNIAKESASSLKSGAKSCLQAYSDGINDYVNSLSVLPYEFYLTQMSWEDWTIEDCIVQGKLLTWTVSVDHIYEIYRTKLAKVVGEEKTREYFALGSEYQFINTEILNDEDLKQHGNYEEYQKISNYTDLGEVFKRLALDMNDDLQQFEGIEQLSSPPGSNSWVISGEYTDTGKPLLANDPHLPNNMPTIWYQQEMMYKHNGKQRSSIGVSIPGMPCIFIGKFDHYAHGVTILFADISDLYLEQIDFENQKYKVDEEWKDLQIRQEIIKVKGRQDVIMDRFETHRGPILRTLFNKNLKKPVLTVEPVSFAWVGNKRDQFHDVLYDILLIEDGDQLVKSAHKMPGPGCTVTYATDKDDIGFLGVGNKPIRKNQRYGAMMKLGNTTEYDWIGEQDPEDWPQIVNPKKGYIVTANNKYASDNIKYGQSVNQFSTARASRIDEMIRQKIESKKKIGVKDMMEMQRDTVDIFAEKVLPQMIKYFKKNGEKLFIGNKLQKIKEFLGKLENWDFKIAVESVEASIFSMWRHNFTGKIFQFFEEEVARNQIVRSFVIDPFLFRKISEMVENLDKTEYSEDWCISEKQQNCYITLFESFYEVEEELNKRVGKNDWRQGILHEQQFPHHAFSPTPLSFIYDRAIRGFGNHNTVAVAIQQLYFDDFHSAYGANYRQVIDFSKGGKSYWVIDTGISESVFSQYYDDQVRTKKLKIYEIA